MGSNEMAVAEKLLQVKAVKINLQQPYTWASGWKSPIYCDNRKLLSHPFIRDFFKSELSSVLFEKFADAEGLAGVATAGIAWGALAADQLKLPFLYVRPKPKEHGLGNQIEGEFSVGQKIVVIEDLISTGKSSLQVCEVLRGAGVDVVGIVALFDYGFNESHSAFESAGIPLFSLSNYQILINEALKQQIISEEQLKTLLNWRANPSAWTGLE